MKCDEQKGKMGVRRCKGRRDEGMQPRNRVWRENNDFPLRSTSLAAAAFAMTR